MERRSRLAGIAETMCRAEIWILGILFFVMLISLIIQVFFRYFLHIPMAWVEELIRYEFIAASFIGCSIAVQQRSHIEINMLPTLLNFLFKSKQKTERGLWVSDIIGYIIGCGFFAYLTYAMLEHTMTSMSYKEISVAMQIPMWTMLALITICCALCVFYYLVSIIVVFQNKTPIISKEEENLSKI